MTFHLSTGKFLSLQEENSPESYFTVHSHMVLHVQFVNYKKHVDFLYLSDDYRTYSKRLHVNIIILRALTHVTLFIRHLRRVIDILCVWLVNLSHSSEVSQLRSPRPFSASAGYADLCQVGVGAFWPVTQPMLH